MAPSKQDKSVVKDDKGDYPITKNVLNSRLPDQRSVVNEMMETQPVVRAMSVAQIESVQNALSQAKKQHTFQDGMAALCRAHNASLPSFLQRSQFLFAVLGALPKQQTKKISNIVDGGSDDDSGYSSPSTSQRYPSNKRCKYSKNNYRHNNSSEKCHFVCYDQVEYKSMFINDVTSASCAENYCVKYEQKGSSKSFSPEGLSTAYRNNQGTIVLVSSQSTRFLFASTAQRDDSSLEQDLTMQPFEIVHCHPQVWGDPILEFKKQNKQKKDGQTQKESLPVNIFRYITANETKIPVHFYKVQFQWASNLLTAKHVYSNPEVKIARPLLLQNEVNHTSSYKENQNYSQQNVRQGFQEHQRATPKKRPSEDGLTMPPTASIEQYPAPVEPQSKYSMQQNGLLMQLNHQLQGYLLPQGTSTPFQRKPQVVQEQSEEMAGLQQAGSIQYSGRAMSRSYSTGKQVEQANVVLGVPCTPDSYPIKLEQIPQSSHITGLERPRLREQASSQSMAATGVSTTSSGSHAMLQEAALSSVAPTCVSLQTNTSAHSLNPQAQMVNSQQVERPQYTQGVSQQWLQYNQYSRDYQLEPNIQQTQCDGVRMSRPILQQTPIQQAQGVNQANLQPQMQPQIVQPARQLSGQWQQNEQPSQQQAQQGHGQHSMTLPQSTMWGHYQQNNQFGGYDT